MAICYQDYSDFLRRYFPFKVQKIMIDAGFSCPNRDGSISTGGCIFCRNDSFSPAYCRAHTSVSAQIEAGKQFFANRYGQMKYLAYFQSFTNTYAPLSELRSKYEEALSCIDVVGLVVSTRPDCIQNDVLEYLQELSRSCFVMLEIGVESCYNSTLRTINRGHTFQCSANAISLASKYHIPVTAHLIFGLPDETPQQMLAEAELISELPVSVIKFHQLQILRDTPIEAIWRKNPERFVNFTPQSYAKLVAEFISKLRSDICIDRFVSQVPASMLVHPRWGLKNAEIQQLVEQQLSMLQSK